MAHENNSFFSLYQYSDQPSENNMDIRTYTAIKLYPHIIRIFEHSDLNAAADKTIEATDILLKKLLPEDEDE